jgi:AmmeMemoRadiSam system protein A
MSWNELSGDERDTLLIIARASIEKGLCGNEPHVRPEEHPERLRAPGASFVTLHMDNELRGCIGSLVARQPLVADVADNAWGAAFRDPRFPAMTWSEFPRLEIHLSLLTCPEPVAISSEQHLLALLRPGVDGLVIEEGYHRGTFLPSVWEQLPDPVEFLRQLKRKAGLPADYWSASLRVSRYTTVSIP